MKHLWISSLLLPLLSSCSLLIGNIKPATEKAENYRVLDLEKENPNLWRKVSKGELQAVEKEEEEQKITSDLTFQNLQTHSIISLNTSCRPSLEDQNITHQEYSKQLLYGFRNVKNKTISPSSLFSSYDAVETKLTGEMNHNTFEVQAIVFKKEACIYDLLLIAQPQKFDQDQKDFIKFASSLKF